MKNHKIITGLLLWAVLSASALFGVNYVPREVIVKTTAPLSARSVNELKFEIPELDEFLSAKGVREIKALTPSPSNRFYTVRLNTQFSASELEKLNSLRHEGVEYIQPNYLNEMFVTPNDPLFDGQFLNQVNLPQAWEYEKGSHQTVVALVDSGLWFDHPEFKSFKNIWINPAEYPPNGEDSDGNGYIDDWCGWDFVDAPEMADIALGDYLEQDNDPDDETGHGTHVAGIIGAETNNGIGIAGICWNVKIMVLRAGFRTTLSSGYLQDDDAAAAIIYAVDNGAHVINISWGSDEFSPVIADVCQYAYEKGVVVVASAGNVPQPKIMYPARLNTTIAVGAVNKNLTLAGFSSYGPDIDIVAPGDLVLSTYTGENEDYYREQSGTSMSSPFVAAAIALLLSYEPGLSVEEVKSRLFASATDLGAPGYDNQYGHGLLNVEKLLMGIDSPLVNITYPLNDVGEKSTFDIIGTIKVPDFKRYSVMYTAKENPTSLDWKDVETHQNTPKYYSTEKHDAKIATFYVPPTLPDDDYIVKITIETRKGSTFEKRFRVHIKQDSPKLKEGYPLAIKRYKGDIPLYYVTLGFDQQVNVSMNVRHELGNELTVFSNFSDSLHVLAIPDYLPEGAVSIQLEARNVSGLHYKSEEYANIINIDKKAISAELYEQVTIGSPFVSISKTRDFNRNGHYEFVGMELNPEQTYGNVKVYEFTDYSLKENYAFPDKFLPLDLGDTNNQGIEVFGLYGDRAVLYETYGTNYYPSIALWSEAGVVGGNLIDYKNKGYDGVVLVQNYQNQLVLNLFARSGNFFVKENRLLNPTPSKSRNTFAPRVVAGDLTGNGYANIVASDLDGDVLVYEIYTPTSDSLLWTTTLPVRNVYYQSIADFTGDGKLDFCVGGYESNYADQNKCFWYFEFFTYDSAERNFKSLGYVSFDHFESTNSIAAIDLDDDGASELVLALTPYLFVVKYIDGEFKPVWYGSSEKTYNVVTLPKTKHHPAGVIVNAKDEEGELKSQFVTSTSHTGPPSPTGLVINPLDETSVKLEWNKCNAERYYIYRLIDEEAVLIDSTAVTNYTDSGLVEGTEYFYSLGAVNSSYTPSVSVRSPWKSVTPLSVPELISIKVTGSKELSLLFSSQLSNEAVNVGNYHVNNGIGQPTSVNHTANHSGLLLRFETSFTEPEEPYLIEIKGLKGRSGVPFPVGEYEFEYQEDTTSPQVLGHDVVKEDVLVISFSEDIEPVSAETIDNYELILPQIDQYNGIKTVRCKESKLEITFKDKLKMSNQFYRLKMNNITDLASNKIPNTQNTIKFQLNVLNDLKYVQAIPNPFNRNQHNQIEIIGLPIEQSGEIRVYSLNGELVYNHTISGLTPHNNTFTWRGVNNSNKLLSSGMYFYVISMGGKQKRGQIAIIN